MMVEKSLWDKILSYEQRLKKMIEQKLRRRLPEGASLLDIQVSIKPVDEHLMKELIEVEVDVTRMLGLEKQCIWYEGIDYHCSMMLGDEPVCDEDSDSYDEKECQRRFEECKKSQLEQFKEENCGLPFGFSYDKKPYIEARLEEYEEEDSYRYCCGVMLRFQYTQYPFKSAIREIVESDNEARYLADMIVAEVLKVIRALRALAD